ncbi:hypothetical protein FQF13_06235 [Escherichia coli]|nr:hypothetical protein [Escherichia coli]
MSPISDADIIIYCLIKFYINKPEQQLMDTFGSDKFNENHLNFEAKIKPFLNLKIGLDRIYDSLTNTSRAYVLFRNAIAKSDVQYTQNDERKVFMSINNMLVNSLMIEFSKFNELINKTKKFFIKDAELRSYFLNLDNFNNRISNSELRKIRNGWFAHPFEDETNLTVFREGSFQNSIFKVLEELTSPESKDDFKKSKDRVLFFCEKYLFSCKNSWTPKNGFTISTKPQEILIDMNKFSTELKKIRLYNIEPFFSVEDKELYIFMKDPAHYIYNDPHFKK